MENLTSEKVKLIELAALKGEREVFKDMGYVCEKNKEKAKEWWLRGAKLGHVDCMLLYAQQNPLRSIVRWKWFCKAAALGNSNGF